MSRSADDRSVAITGASCLLPGAKDLRTFWRNVVAGRSAITERPADRWPPMGLAGGEPEPRITARGGFVPGPVLFDAARHRVMPAAVRGGDPDQFILLDVVTRALDDAGIGRDDPRRAKADLVVARGGYLSSVMFEAQTRADGIARMRGFLERHAPSLAPRDLDRIDEEALRTLPPRDVDRLATCIPNLVASRTSNRLDLGGGAFVVDAACASALVALELAVDRLRSGRCDLAIVAAIHFTHVPAFWHVFEEIGALSPTGEMRPFDRGANGLLIGEGAGAVILERPDDAARLAGRVHAVVRGVGASSDGSSAGILAPSTSGQVLALKRAWDDAGLDPSSMRLLEAHGTATAAGDAAEVATIRTFFGERTGALPLRTLGSVKSMIGHAMPASGMASLLKTALAVSQGILPPSLGCAEPRADMEGLDFDVTSRARPWIEPAGRPRRAGVNAFGFGGVNGHVVLEEPPRPKAPPVSVAVPGLARPVECALPRPSELLAFSGADRADVAAALRRAARFVREDRGGAELTDVAHALAAEATPGALVRLGVVAATLDGLPGRLDRLAAALESGARDLNDADAFFREGPASPGRIAAIFPGIGFPGLVGEFPEHLVQLALHAPTVRDVFETVEARDGHPGDPVPTMLLLSPPEHAAPEAVAAARRRLAPPSIPSSGVAPPIERADERNLAHVGMLVGEQAGWRLLGELGVQVDAACGQSLGDLAAAWASGIASFEEDVSHLWRALSDPNLFQGAGRMGLVAMGEEALRPHLRGLDVSLALHLSPDSVVVGGDETDVRALCAKLMAQGVLAQALPFPAVHTPHWTDVQRKLEQLVGDSRPLRLPTLPIYSAVLEGRFPQDIDAIREALYGNFTRPVRFWQTLRVMREDGCRIFIQVGTGTLAANARTALEEGDACFLGLDAPGMHPVAQIQRTCAELFVRGAAIDLRRLTASAGPRPVDLAAPRPAAIRSPAEVELRFFTPPLTVDPLAAGCADRQRTRHGRVAGWGGGRGSAPTDGEACGSPPVPRGQAGLPFLGRVERHVPGVEIAVDLDLRLDEDLYLADHAFLDAQSVKPLAERMPVMPLTVALEMLAESAACLAPGLGLVGFQDVRARRWLGILDAESLGLRVEARVLADAGDGRVRVRAQAGVPGAPPSVEGTALFAAEYAETLRLAFTEGRRAMPFPETMEQVYGSGILFHGPAFRCVTAIGQRTERGLVGEIVVPPRDGLFASWREPQLLLDPVVLDGAGQLVGLHAYEQGSMMLPVAIDALEIYGPPPPPGATLPTRVEIEPRDPGAPLLAASFEISDGEGGVWLRVRGWRDRVFAWTEALASWMRRHERSSVATRLAVPGLPPDAVVVTVGKDVLRDADVSWVARFALGREEMREMEALPAGSPRQVEWLLGRMACKEAVRLWASAPPWPVHPAQVRVSAGDGGRPAIASWPLASTPPHVSITHSDGVATAIACSRPVGIDSEADGAGGRLRLADFATDAEQAAVTRGEPWAATALWCAKEAAAKAAGEGLSGRPKRFVAREWRDGAPSLVADESGRASSDVRVTRAGGRVVAVATRRG